MKREIKFRAWNGEFIEGNVIPLHHDEILELNTITGTPRIKKVEAVMQYTGLKDKNGVEIYEGDIVHSYYEILGTEDGKNYFGTGKYKHEYSQVVEFREGAFWSGSLMKSKENEVIGNIYENPELLNKN